MSFEVYNTMKKKNLLNIAYLSKKLILNFTKRKGHER